MTWSTLTVYICVRPARRESLHASTLTWSIEEQEPFDAHVTRSCHGGAFVDGSDVSTWTDGRRFGSVAADDGMHARPGTHTSSPGRLTFWGKC
jgi:hypothetical protein